ncbi:MAG: DUF3179 domain-containing protein [Dehalococcoidia bacterium]
MMRGRRSLASVRRPVPLVVLAVLLMSCGPVEEPSARSSPAVAETPRPAAATPTAATPAPRETPPPEPRFTREGWTTDFSRHIVPLAEIEPGGPPKDGIPPIDDPRFVSVAEAGEFLLDMEPVIVVQHGGATRAYPLQVLMWHEIVNDVIQEEPIVVTYCPLCNTAIAFSRHLNGDVLDFGTTGNLRHSDLVMYDRQTESWWQQITGEGIVGELAGARLEVMASGIFAFADVRDAHPDALVLSTETGFQRPYGANPYLGYDTGSPFRFDGSVDDQLFANERVVSVLLDEEAVAYPFGILRQEQVVNDEVGGAPIAVFFQPGALSPLDAEVIGESRAIGTGVVFDRRVEDRTLTFQVQGDEMIVDEQTESTWDIHGRAIRGDLAGTQLEPVVHGNHFWFAWAVFQPDSRVYTGR